MKKQICKNCTFYSAYYKQMSTCYTKLTYGYCQKHKKAITQTEQCEGFVDDKVAEENKAKLRLKRLEQTIFSINEIAQILKDKEQDKE